MFFFGTVVNKKIKNKDFIMANYATPGVYVEEKSVLPGSVAGVSTAIPAFIGYTEKGADLVNTPTKISTLKEYEDQFGAGPATAITVTVAADESITGIETTEPTHLMYYAMQMYFANGGESCYIVPVGGTDFSKAIDALRLEDEPTLIVIVDKNADYYALCGQVLLQCNDLKDRFGVFDVIQTASGVDADVEAFRASAVGSNYLKYGAAYYPYVKTALPYYYNETDVDVVIDSADAVKLNTIENSKTALYNAIKKEIAKLKLTLPPSAAIAGAYASVDRDRGVWKSPANISLVNVLGPALKLTEEENDGLNIDPVSGKSINAIRSFTGKGTLVWGARTLAGNDNEWRYISVRRLFNYIEESIQKATAFAVFEPNNAMTWLKVRSMIESFLDNMWRQGALAGGKVEDAYFVQVGLGTTMTQTDILEGKLIIKIGLAAVRPAEFIILEFTHKLQES